MRLKANNMKKEYTKERVKTLKDITARHESREILGCTSWRHFAVHQDRAWLLNALGKIQRQVEKVRQAESNDKTKLEVELQRLFAMFEEEALNRVGDRDN